MNNNQITLLIELTSLLMKLDKECEKDQEFNHKLGSLNIFSKCINECFHICYDELYK